MKLQRGQSAWNGLKRQGCNSCENTSNSDQMTHLDGVRWLRIWRRLIQGCTRRNSVPIMPQCRCVACWRTIEHIMLNHWRIQVRRSTNILAHHDSNKLQLWNRHNWRLWWRTPPPAGVSGHKGHIASAEVSIKDKGCRWREEEWRPHVQGSNGRHTFTTGKGRRWSSA